MLRSARSSEEVLVTGLSDSPIPLVQGRGAASDVARSMQVQGSLLAEVHWEAPLSKWRRGVGCAAVRSAMLMPLTAPTAAMPRKSWSRAGADAPIPLKCVVWLHRHRSCREQHVPRRQVAVVVPQGKSARGERPRPSQPRRRGWLPPPWRPTGADQVRSLAGHAPHAKVSCGKCMTCWPCDGEFMSAQRSKVNVCTRWRKPRGHCDVAATGWFIRVGACSGGRWPRPHGPPN